MTGPLPIVLVPGLICSARLYAEQISSLWACGPIIIADHRRDDSVAAIAARILAMAPPRFALAGLSMGGYIAFAIAREAPERVTRLALLDTSARPDTPEQTERRHSMIALADSGRFAEVPDLLFPVFVHRDRHGDEALRTIVRTMAEETGPQAFVRQQHAIMTRPDCRPLLKSIRCPTLVLVGDGDALTPPMLSEEIAAGVAGARRCACPIVDTSPRWSGRRRSTGHSSNGLRRDCAANCWNIASPSRDDSPAQCYKRACPRSLI